MTSVHGCSSQFKTFSRNYFRRYFINIFLLLPSTILQCNYICVKKGPFNHVNPFKSNDAKSCEEKHYCKIQRRIFTIGKGSSKKLSWQNGPNFTFLTLYVLHMTKLLNLKMSNLINVTPETDLPRSSQLNIPKEIRGKRHTTLTMNSTGQDNL